MFQDFPSPAIFSVWKIVTYLYFDLSFLMLKQNTSFKLIMFSENVIRQWRWHLAQHLSEENSSASDSWWPGWGAHSYDNRDKAAFLLQVAKNSENYYFDPPSHTISF